MASLTTSDDNVKNAAPAAPAAGSTDAAPLTVGVFGGSFNPIHLGHALLAITVKQTKAVDEVVLVPVYKHAVKQDLLPFDDRVEMCELAVQGNPNVTVSTVERDVGESNGAMLRGLRERYPAHTRFLWICGDDFFRWMHRPKGLETLREVSGLIVQRRLHRSDHDSAAFFKEPIDEAKIRNIALKMDLEIDFVYGELPHFSSTLVRRAPGHWRSFLTNGVARYLDERPHLLQMLLDNLEADAARELQQKQQQSNNNNNNNNTIIETKLLQHQRTPSTLQSFGAATEIIMRGLQVAHALQFERGHASLRLSLGREHGEALREARATTDALLQQDDETAQLVQQLDEHELPEVQALAAELQRIPVWLDLDRRVLEARADRLAERPGTDGWLARLSLVEKFNPRVDVLVGATMRALAEILEHGPENSHRSNNSNRNENWQLTELLFKWCEAKEAVGRLRAFVCAGGSDVPTLVRNSLPLRDRLVQTIETKERKLNRVLQLQGSMAQTRLSAPDALHILLHSVSWMEYKLMGCFASSTPLPLIHRLMAEHNTVAAGGALEEEEFDVVEFFDASTTAINFLLSFSKALAASACASA